MEVPVKMTAKFSDVNLFKSFLYGSFFANKLRLQALHTHWVLYRLIFLPKKETVGTSGTLKLIIYRDSKHRYFFL